MELFNLGGRRAFVTGSSQGLGLAMAEGLGKAGAALILNGRNRGKLEKARRSLEKKGIESYGYAFDVTDERAVTSGINAMEKEVGPIDILINNAGINLRSPVEVFPAENWHKVMDILLLR